MFELEDLYDYAIDGAFKSLEEFLEMAPTLGYDGLFDYLEEGTFKDVAELEASNVLGLKKKRKNYLALLQRKIRMQILQYLRWRMDPWILHQSKLLTLH